MIASTALIELLARLGAELDFDVARNVESRKGTIDIVWFDRNLPLAAVISDPIDLDHAPVLPVIAFAARTATDFEAANIAGLVSEIESTGAPLRIIVIARDTRQPVLAPVLQSVDQLRKQDDDAALHDRIADWLRAHSPAQGRTIVMRQLDLVDWARRLREAHPRSYSAESLFQRTDAID